MQILKGEAIRAFSFDSLAGTVGFVPTMGALHAGHEALIETARDDCDTVLVSVYVNPTQFAEGEDFDQYPRTFEVDAERLQRLGVDVMICPSDDVMYPEGKNKAEIISVPVQFSHGLCGRSRPGFFDGVATVVSRFFELLSVDKAYFGEKDFQQLAVIRWLIESKSYDIELVPCAIQREVDGLAYSSRNQYLDAVSRRQATVIFQALSAAEAAFQSGERDLQMILGMAEDILAMVPNLETDYLAVVDSLSLQEQENGEIGLGNRLCYAGTLQGTRLIDNIALDQGFVL